MQKNRYDVQVHDAVYVEYNENAQDKKYMM